MKKMNNKGFVLAETLLVSTIILLTFTLLYKNGIPLINEYIRVRNYDDMDTVYIANLFQQILVSDDNYMDIVNETNAKKYVDLTDCSKLSNVNLCQKYKDMNEIGENDKIVLSTKLSASTNLKNDILNNVYKVDRNFKEYVDYLYNKGETVADYVLIISRTVDAKKKVIEGAQIKEEIKKVTKFASVDLGGE